MVKRNIASIILAAGSSSRLGFPKQLLVYNGATFIENSIKVAQEAGCTPIVVVVGANSEKIIPVLEGYPVHVVINEDWQKGMGSSIVNGLNVIVNKAVDASVFMVCDQPYVSSDHVLKLIEAYNTSTHHIVATLYEDAIGVPALFDKRYFPALQGLKGNEGAKKLFIENSKDLSTVIFQKAAIDIDTMEDYNKLEK